jgi:hypothetical protein
MGLLSKLFGVSQEPNPAAPSGPAVQTLRLPGPGLFSLEAVGESNYQEALERICGGRSYDGADLLTDATLVHEDTNPYDPEAVRIDIAGGTVGYLSRAHARIYRRQMAMAGHAGRVAVCAARIRGGWDRGEDDRGSYGVRLDVAVLPS